MEIELYKELPPKYRKKTVLQMAIVALAYSKREGIPVRWEVDNDAYWTFPSDNIPNMAIAFRRSRSILSVERWWNSSKITIDNGRDKVKRNPIVRYLRFQNK